MRFDLKVWGLEEAIAGTDQIAATIGPVTLEGLIAGVNAVIAQAQANLYETPEPTGYHRTGTGGASLQIQSIDSDGKSHTIIAGSLLEYLWWQEVGYTSRGGRAIPGKWFFMRAVETVRPQFTELMLSKIIAVIPWKGVG